MHPILTVQAPPGVLYVNGRYVGESAGLFTPLVRDGCAVVEYRPLGRWSGGIAMKLNFKAGQLESGLPQDAYAVEWPGNVVELELRGDVNYDMPTPHATLRTPYGSLNLIERNREMTIGYDGMEATVLPLTGPFFGVRMVTQPHPTMPLVSITGNCDQGDFNVVIRLDNPPQIMSATSERPAAYTPPPSPAYAKTPYDVSRAWLEFCRDGLSGEASSLLMQPTLQSRLSQDVGLFDQVVDLKYPLPGLAPIELGALTVTSPQIARVRAVGFVGRAASDGWKIERVIPD